MARSSDRRRLRLANACPAQAGIICDKTAALGIRTSDKPLRFEHFTPMGIISAIIIGLIIGAIAKFLMPGKDPGGWIVTILIGVAGSFIGTYLGQAVGLYRTGEPAGFIGSIVGAMILLLLYRLVVKRRA